MSLTQEGNEDEWNRQSFGSELIPHSERGRAEESPGEGLLGEGSSDPVMQGLLRVFQNLAMSMWAPGYIDTLLQHPGYKDGSKIVKYIRGLEADLNDVGVQRSQFERILLSRLWGIYIR